jgi:hypothetical protein
MVWLEKLKLRPSVGARSMNISRTEITLHIAKFIIGIFIRARTIIWKSSVQTLAYFVISSKIIVEIKCKREE